MDSYEATRIVLSRIQSLDPENASKIIGLLLLQDHGEKEMIRLAFGPEALVRSVILKARKELGLGLQNNNSPPTPTTPSSPSPSSFLSNPQAISKQNNSAFSKSTTWGSTYSEPQNPDELISPNSSLNPSSLPFYGHGSAGSDMIDELQLQDQLSFLMDNNSNSSQDLFYPRTELSSSPNGTDLGFPPYWGHKRSCSVSDVLGSSDPNNDPNSGLGWRPCLYFARGYCKNGTSCRFIHGGLGDLVNMGVDGGGSGIGSPGKIEMMERYTDFLRSKSAQHQQQKLAAASQLMASASSFPYSPKGMNLLLQQQNDSQRPAAAALMMGEDMYKFGRSRLERNGFSFINGDLNPASRQIYLTFPADSTFREEDVSNYFSIYGPVQDVRIPYQQKRMFGFVTFVYPETVKIILAKGNPHFVCDARVLVKPYKEKGKVPDKYRKQQQNMERGEFSPCGTPTGLDSRDPFDIQLGARMFYNNNQDMWRRKLEEQADLQQALDLQSRRLMGLQLLDVKKQQHHRAVSTGSPIPSPTRSPSLFNQPLVLPQFHAGQELSQENGSSSLPAISATAPEKKLANISAADKESAENAENGEGKERPQRENGDLPESLEHNLPDSPFASPTKSAGEYLAFSNAGESFKDQYISASSTNSNPVSSTSLPANNALDMASFKSFNCQMPSFSSGHGGIGMYTGTGGPTCPVGI